MAKKDTVVQNATDKMRALLAEHKLTIVKLAEDYEDMDVECISTGFPQLDYIMRKVKGGVPRGRDIEIFSKQPEVGKTTLGLEMVKSAQTQGDSCAIIDLEKTITLQYLHQIGIVTDSSDPNITAVFLVRFEDDAIPAEQILETIRQLGKLFDVILVDSVAVLESKADLDKEAGEDTRVGGVSKMLSAFLRKNVAKRAGIIWINQTRMKVGPSGPGGPGYVTTGGRGLPFYASIRLSLEMAFPKYKIQETKDGPILGTRVQVTAEKNKIAPQFGSCILTYLFGKSFSKEYDYYEIALAAGVVIKKGAWISISLPKVPAIIDNDTSEVIREEIPAGEFKKQGVLAFVTAMREHEHPLLMETIRKAVDGEPAEEEEMLLAS